MDCLYRDGSYSGINYLYAQLWCVLPSVLLVGSGYILAFEHETDHHDGDTLSGVLAWSDGTPIYAGY